MSAVDRIEAVQAVVAVIAVVVLGVAAGVTLVRLSKGPTSLDRIIASDLIVGIAVGGLALQVVLSDRLTTLPILLALSLVGFIGAVSMARFVHDQVPGSTGEFGRRARRRGDGRRPSDPTALDPTPSDPTPSDLSPSDPASSGTDRSGGA
ncbi:monovalent cation/H+ antiporter complex subunit F [Raineyella sp. LH-20]|uniref:monovalent cation/H+ antiporter complex subunit F n=1 Tax=Raineyella sp. LH-20 TaxID=3081204 RepID=UPI002953378F|nr:monovalent cation/H+ antiporter complex subunit F [Raineyella sp. LH-20]WOP18495.1 monovalent cation/H+ antiporter complex subunit F [Raineyella sp. LH-20]